MACPAPPMRSSSNWLDRLRTSKGLPPHHDGQDLDHFLLLPDTSPPSSFSPSLPATAVDKPLIPQSQQHEQKTETTSTAADGKQWFDIMSCALAELFHMGNQRELRASRTIKKGSRKQPHPRICVASVPASNASSCPTGEQVSSGGLVALSPPSAENSSVGAKKWPDVKTKARRKRARCRGVADSSDLAGYSRTEVTVIDTSSPSWKSQKVILMKGLVWKVREKKALTICRKKRKLGVVKRLAAEKGNGEPPKREALGKERLASSNGGLIHHDWDDPSKDTSNSQNHIPENRALLLLPFPEPTCRQ